MADEPEEVDGADTDATETDTTTAPHISAITEKIDSALELLNSIKTAQSKLAEDFGTFMDATAAPVINDDNAEAVDSDGDGDTDIIVTDDGQEIDPADLAADVDDLDY